MDTNGIEYTTWFDQRPSHPVQPDWLWQAEKRVELANAAYDAHIESVLAGNGTPWEPLLTQLLEDICVQAERELRVCQEQWGRELAERDYQQTIHDTNPRQG